MRHIRDPITGYCIICEKNNIRHFVAPNELDDTVSSTQGDRSSRAGRPESKGKKTIYVSANPDRSPSTLRPTSSSSSASDSASMNSAGKSTMISSRSTSKVVLIDRRSPSPSARGTRSPSPGPTQGKRGASPTPKGRQASPDGKRGCCRGRCCNKTGRGTKGLDDKSPFESRSDRCCGYKNFETASYGAGTWGIRRWCAPFIVLLVLMALAGLATGIYFGVKAVNANKARNKQVRNFVKSSQVRYVVYGADQPCNAQNNNNGKTTTLKPNCKDVTTRIGPPPGRFVAPTDPEWAMLLATAASGARGRSLMLSLTSLGDAGLVAWVVGVVMWRALASLGSGLYG